MQDVLLPELGEEITEAVVAHWHVAVGDAVKEGDDVVEMVTDKATFNVPASANGCVKEILFNKGDTAPIGAVLAKIEGN